MFFSCLVIMSVTVKWPQGCLCSVPPALEANEAVEAEEAEEASEADRHSRHHIGNTHSCLLLYYILAEEELFPLLLLAAEISVSVEINVHDNASIVVIVLKIWWCPLGMMRLLRLLSEAQW